MDMEERDKERAKEADTKARAYDLCIGIELSYRDVRSERRRQDIKHGGPKHDDEHCTAEFAQFIRDRCDILQKPEDFLHLQRKLMVEIAALAVASTESIDRRTQKLKLTALNSQVK